MGEVTMLGIDTINLVTEGMINESNLKRIAEMGSYNTYHYPEEDYKHYKARIGNNPQMPFIKYTKQNKRLSVEVPSAPYFMFGTSLKQLSDDDAEMFFSKLEYVLIKELGVELSQPPSEWKVRNFDVYHDFQLGSDVTEYIRAMRNIKIPRYKTGNEENETVHWRNKTRDIKFYDKHQDCIDKRRSKLDIELSKGIGRFEVEIKPLDITSELGIEKVTLSEVFNESVTNHLVKKYLRLIKMDDLEVTTEGKLLESLIDNFGATWAHKLVSYARSIESGHSTSIPRATRARYENKYKEVGIAPVIGSRPLSPLKLEDDIQNTKQEKVDDKRSKKGKRVKPPTIFKKNKQPKAN
jgi:hypothetical protein